MKPGLTIGLFGIGLEAYWEQFAGLKQRLEGYLATVHKKLSAVNISVIDLGLIDNVEKAFAAGREFRAAGADILFLYPATYALSSTVLPLVQRAKVPVIILNLAPEASIDYAAFNAMTDRRKMTGEWLAFCSACPVPEMANVFKRTGIDFFQVTGMLDDEETWNEIREWVDAARVMKTMAYNRLGCMGHYYGGMLDTYTDLTTQYKYFGGHIEMIEVEELAALRKAVTQASIQERLGLFYELFDVDPGYAAEDMEQAAISSVALDTLVA